MNYYNKKYENDFSPNKMDSSKRQCTLSTCASSSERRRKGANTRKEKYCKERRQTQKAETEEIQRNKIEKMRKSWIQHKREQTNEIEIKKRRRDNKEDKKMKR